MFSLEETQVNKNREAIAVVSILAFLGDRLRNAKPVIQLNTEMETAIKECIQAVWKKDTLLSRTPCMWRYTRYQMVVGALGFVDGKKVLEGLGRQFQDPVTSKHFAKCVAANETGEMVMDCLLVEPRRVDEE